MVNWQVSQAYQEFFREACVPAVVAAVLDAVDAVVVNDRPVADDRYAPAAAIRPCSDSHSALFRDAAVLCESAE